MYVFSDRIFKSYCNTTKNACYKLGFRFGRMDVIKKFLASDRPGIYFRVLEEGEVGDEDSIVLINRDRDLVTVSDIVRLYINDTADIKTMGCAVKVDALPDGWKCHFLEQIERVEKHESKIK